MQDEIFFILQQADCGGILLIWRFGIWQQQTFLLVTILFVAYIGLTFFEEYFQRRSLIPLAREAEKRLVTLVLAFDHKVSSLGDVRDLAHSLTKNLGHHVVSVEIVIAEVVYMHSISCIVFTVDGGHRTGENRIALKVHKYLYRAYLEELTFTGIPLIYLAHGSGHSKSDS